MSSLTATRSTRYILLLAFALLLSLWLWRPSFHHQFQSPPQLPSAFIPIKLYEPAAACTDNLADEFDPGIL